MKIKSGLVVATCCAFSLMTLPTAYAGNVTFVAADNSMPTKLCVNAVQNDLQTTKSLMRRMTGSTLRSPGAQVKMVSETILCNDVDIVKFTAMYGADDTFNYLNHHTSWKYKIDDSVDIIDLSAGVDHNIVIMVSAK
ncbi:hypothetical protein [Thalassotalea maritima]|uniref:hypothetical protein n=1 Tax=Thalassotalea maritima TaxID=3242416 RepID=UPI0035270251